MYITLANFLYLKEFLKMKLTLNNFENSKKLISSLGVSIFFDFKTLILILILISI